MKPPTYGQKRLFAFAIIFTLMGIAVIILQNLPPIPTDDTPVWTSSQDDLTVPPAPLQSCPHGDCKG